MAGNTSESEKFALGFILGAITGALLGVLFAPKKGTETRKIAKTFAQKYLGKIEKVRDTVLEDINKNKNEILKVK